MLTHTLPMQFALSRHRAKAREQPTHVTPSTTGGDAPVDNIKGTHAGKGSEDVLGGISEQIQHGHDVTAILSGMSRDEVIIEQAAHKRRVWVSLCPANLLSGTNKALSIDVV